jgi:hypothetical protein
VAVVLLPSMLAAEAGGASRFEPDAETVGEALRALPVASLVFDEGIDTRLEGGETIRLVAAIAGG